VVKCARKRLTSGGTPANAGVNWTVTTTLPSIFYGSDGAYAKLSPWVHSKGMLREAPWL